MYVYVGVLIACPASSLTRTFLIASCAACARKCAFRVTPGLCKQALCRRGAQLTPPSTHILAHKHNTTAATTTNPTALLPYCPTATPAAANKMKRCGHALFFATDDLLDDMLALRNASIPRNLYNYKPLRPLLVPFRRRLDARDVRLFFSGPVRRRMLLKVPAPSLPLPLSISRARVRALSLAHTHLLSLSLSLSLSRSLALSFSLPPSVW